MCKHRRKPAFFFQLLTTLLVAATPACLAADLVRPATPGHAVTVTIHNNKSPGTTLYLAVYAADSEQASWQQERHQALKLVLPPGEQAEVELELANGRYAMRAFADVNGNNELDTQRFNRPVEPFAISMATGRDKPSMRFHNAVVGIDEDNRSVQLTLIYPEDLAEAAAASDDGN